LIESSTKKEAMPMDEIMTETMDKGNTGADLAQDDIDKLMNPDGAGKKDVDQDKLADDWAKSLEDGQDIEEGKPLEKGAKKATFTEFEESKYAGPSKELDFILDIPLEITVEMGRTRMLINDLLQIGQGSVIELNRLAGEPLDILVNNKLIARGEVVVVSEKFGIRITDIVSPMERVKRLA
jgi:flagellar motor switch protein FliN/FliY